jgi:hypothetical protein
MSFSEFVASGVPFLSLYLDNFHTRQLTMSGWVNRTVFPSAVAIAAWRIYHMRWFYVCEHPESSAEWLKRAFPAFAGIVIDQENRTLDGYSVCSVSAADRSVILSRNSYDHLLYQLAISLLGHRSTLGQPAFSRS